MVQMATYPAAPIAEPLEGTLLDIIGPLGGSIGWLDGTGQFESVNCLDTGIRPGETCGPVSTSKFTDAGSPSWNDGLKFAAYGVAVCKMIDQGSLSEMVDRAFLATESRSIERALMEDLFVENAAGSGLPGSWEAATDITPVPGTPVSPKVGIGLLESHMGANYAGKGIIHMPRVIAAIVGPDGVIDFEGPTLRTKLRTPVAAGAGYDLPNTGPTGAAAPAGTKWIYGTGQVVAQRLKLDPREILTQFPGVDTGLAANDVAALTEAVYIVTIDCYKAAVLVSI